MPPWTLPGNSSFLEAVFVIFFLMIVLFMVICIFQIGQKAGKRIFNETDDSLMLSNLVGIILTGIGIWAFFGFQFEKKPWWIQVPVYFGIIAISVIVQNLDQKRETEIIHSRP